VYARGQWEKKEKDIKTRGSRNRKRDKHQNNVAFGRR